MSALLEVRDLRTCFPGSAGPLPVVDGVSFDLARGEVTVVNFFASWCGPCVQEHPHLMALEKRGVRIVGVNYKDPSPGGRRFLGRYGNPYVAVGTDASGRGAIEWGVYGVPETYVIDREGRIRYRHVGPVLPDAMENTIMPLIEELKK